jgi:hypothetical protein
VPRFRHDPQGYRLKGGWGDVALINPVIALSSFVAKNVHQVSNFRRVVFDLLHEGVVYEFFDVVALEHGR